VSDLRHDAPTPAAAPTRSPRSTFVRRDARGAGRRRSHGDLAQALALAVYEHGRHASAEGANAYSSGDLIRALSPPRIRYDDPF
jgi:hypothetical protein